MGEQIPKVSIIIPTFNRASYLSMAINSAIEQTYPNTEIIVLDDCSSDGTISASEEYREKMNVKFIRNEKNIGFINNWNRGIELSAGEYIKIMGDDDLLDKNCIAEQVKVLDKNPDVGVVCCNYFIIDENNVITQDNTDNPHRLFHTDTKENGKDFIIDRLLRKRFLGWPTAILFRRRDIDKVGLFDINIGCPADIDLWCRILCSSNFYYLDKVLAYNRQFPGNLEKKLTRQPLGYKDDMRFWFKTVPCIENRIDRYTKGVIWMNIIKKIYPYYLNADKRNRSIVLRDLMLVRRNLSILNKLRLFIVLAKNFLGRIRRSFFKAR